MDAKSTVGVRVKLTISEPWEGSGESVLVTVEAEAGGAWLLRLILYGWHLEEEI